MYLNLNGIPTEFFQQDTITYLSFDPQGVWRLNQGDLSYELEAVCINIHEALRMNVMQEAPYNDLFQEVPYFTCLSGLNSESALSKADFEKYLRLSTAFPEMNRFLYLYDVQKLVSSIQVCVKELMQIVGEFYRTLNIEPLFYPPIHQNDGIRYNTSSTVTKLFAFLTFIFVRMHSLLDFIVKLAIEAKELPLDFTKYPKMRSLNEQFGGRKKVSFNKTKGTLFEECEFITMIETLRNHLIHDGLLDDMPKAYERIEHGVAVERFVLFPDMTQGRLDRYVSRPLSGEFSPDLFNKEAVAKYLVSAKTIADLPLLEIEAYMTNVPDYKGTNNSLLKDTQGVRVKASFDPDFTVAYAKEPITRDLRAAHAKTSIHNTFNAKQEAFIDFVLAQYVNQGVEELDSEKLSPLLRLKYNNAIADAVADLGKPDEISRMFSGFQTFLYQKSA